MANGSGEGGFPGFALNTKRELLCGRETKRAGALYVTSGVTEAALLFSPSRTEPKTWPLER